MNVYATVRVELDLIITQGWGDDCTLGQVKKQAIDSARKDMQAMVTNLLREPTSFRIQQAGRVAARLRNLRISDVKLEEGKQDG